MPWWLVPLHGPRDPATELPREGTATVGRRPTNTIVCRDLAVSGQHCVLHCHKGGLDEPPEVEDLSTNGTYINEAKLSKGQRQILAANDILSLTKQVAEDEKTVRVQFRVEFRDAAAGASQGLSQRAAATPLITDELPLTGPEAPPPANVGNGGETSFAQDLLVQEQQAKARITGELLLSQRKLEDERQAVESMNRELRKLRQQVDEERARRQEAEEGRDRYMSEAEALRSKAWELGERRVAFEDLRQRQETGDAELVAQRNRCTQLHAATEQLRLDVQRATERRQHASQQQAEIMTRLRQAQERGDRLEQQHAEAQREADRASDEGSRLKQELDAERKKREELETQVNTNKELLAKNEGLERSAREQLDAATARNAELECKAAAAQNEAEGARANVRQARSKLVCATQLADHLNDAAMLLVTELKRRADLWEKSLMDGCYDEVEEECRSHLAGTFVQVTHRQEDTQPKSPNNAVTEDRSSAISAPLATAPDVGEAAPEANSAIGGAGRNPFTDEGKPSSAESGLEGTSGQRGGARRSPAKDPPAATVCGDPAATLMAVLPDDQQFVPEPAATAVGVDDEDDSDEMSNGSALRNERQDVIAPGLEDGEALLDQDFHGHLAGTGGSHGFAAVPAPGGVSAAWSLEVVEVGSPAEQHCFSSAPALKRPRFA